MRPKKSIRAGFRPDKTDLKPERADCRLGKAGEGSIEAWVLI